jgi:DNA-binding LacI/PurR family transcriptional regulator
MVNGEIPHRVYADPAAEWLLTKGYRLRPYYLSDKEGMKEKELARILGARGVEGILVAPMAPRVSRLDLPWEKFSGVALGRALEDPCLPKVDGDAYAAMRMCYSRLKELGCKRIGAIIPSLHDRLIGDAYRSAFWGLSSGEPKSHRVEILDVNRPTYRELTREELEVWRQRYQVDGIICLRADVLNLQRIGYQIPEDFQVVVVNLHDAEVSCAGVMTNDREIGIAAASQLLFAIQHGIRGSWKTQSLTLIKGQWVEPDSGG